jgi:hypothetical protein
LLPSLDCRRGVPFGEHTIWQSTHPVRIVEVKTKTKAAFIEQMAGRAGIARSQTNYSNRFIQPVVTVLPGGAISSAD